MRSIFAVFALLVVTGASFAVNPTRVDFSAFGDARIGLSESALSTALAAPLVRMDADVEIDGCHYVAAATVPREVGLMMLDGRLARIDVFEPGIQTVAGAEVGMTEARLKQLYGAGLVQTPHAYAGPEGHYLTLASADGRHGLRFETDGHIVTGFYAGTAEAIQLIEGCL